MGVGDKVNIKGRDFTVVGVYESAYLEAKKLYMSISDAQTITDITGANRLDVYAENISYVDKIADTIKSKYPNLHVMTYKERLSHFEEMQRRYQDMLQNAASALSQMQTIATQEIGIVIVATSLIVLFTMLYTVRERTKEVGILKAIGFSNWNVMSQFMLEGILMSLMAGVVGVVMGSVGAPLLSSLLLPQVNPYAIPVSYTHLTLPTKA